MVLSSGNKNNPYCDKGLSRILAKVGMGYKGVDCNSNSSSEPIVTQRLCHGSKRQKSLADSELSMQTTWTGPVCRSSLVLLNCHHRPALNFGEYGHGHGFSCSSEQVPLFKGHADFLDICLLAFTFNHSFLELQFSALAHSYRSLLSLKFSTWNF